MMEGGFVRILVVIPVFNERDTAASVARHVRRYADDVLLINDGSTDGTGAEIDRIRGPLGLHVIHHGRNLGYGRALRDAFAWAENEGFDWVISMDCDEQHEPDALPGFFSRISMDDADIISGSRYLFRDTDPTGSAPAGRRRINRLVTAELNDRLGLSLTDGFCGFKAHRVETLRRLTLTEDGYAFPMQLWVQLAAKGARIVEHPVRLIYLDPNRSFGGGLDDDTHRLAHYRAVLHDEIRRFADDLPESAWADLCPRCCCDRA